jgi:hypothetical protein
MRICAAKVPIDRAVLYSNGIRDRKVGIVIGQARRAYRQRAIEQGRSTEVAEITLEALEVSLHAFERQRRLLLDRLKERER